MSTHPATEITKLAIFLEKLAHGRYKRIGDATAALYSTRGLTGKEIEQAKEEIAAYFANKPPMEEEAPTAAPDMEDRHPYPLREVAALIGTSTKAKTQAEAAALNALRTQDLDENAVRHLIGMALEFDNHTLFKETLEKYAATHGGPSSFNPEDWVDTKDFFAFIETLFSVKKHQGHHTGNAIPVIDRQIQLRSGDPHQVQLFEKAAHFGITNPRRAGLEDQEAYSLRTIAVNYASLPFVMGMLQASQDPAHIHQFAHRLIGLYFSSSSDIGAAEIFEFVNKLHPEDIVVEELMRVFFAQRQLGDALHLLGMVPESYRSQLYQVVHPVVMQYGDPVALLGFAVMFPTRVNRDEIKKRIKAFFEVDIDKNIDAAIDGTSINDYFEAVPSTTDQAARQGLRQEVEQILGRKLPPETAKEEEEGASAPSSGPEGFAAAMGTMPGFLQDLLKGVSFQKIPIR
jgi:hypothetical protein